MYVESFSGTGSLTKHFVKPMRAFTIVNDGEMDLTFSIDSQAFLVKPTEEFTDTFPSFYGVIVTASSPWRAYVEGVENPNALPVSTLFLELRYELRDMDKLKYSDHELLVVLNTALSLINNYVAKDPNIRIFSTKEEIALTDGEARLPSDFLRLISISDTSGNPLETSNYSILGERLYASGYSELTLKYNYLFGRINATNEIVPVPSFFNDFVKKYMRMLLTGEHKDMMGLIAGDIYRLSHGREYVGYERPMPFALL